MYIAPNTNINILHNVPLDATYRNTLYFSVITDQIAYFQKKVKYAFTNQSYQRVQKGTLRIAQSADNLYDCNYIMFQNAAYGQKWFYAFITGVEYVNNETSEITFEIDVMQTWCFDYTVNMSYVEREMALGDGIGANLVPENLEIGEYMYTDLGIPEQLSTYHYIVAATFDKQFQPTGGQIYGGVYSGVILNEFFDVISTINFIQQATVQNVSEGIVSVFMIPAPFTAAGDNPASYNVSYNKAYDTIAGYVPKNNKLFTYPYNILYVTNNEGSVANFRYEFFDSNTCDFQLSGLMSCAPELMLTPQNYKNVAVNYNEKILCGNFPQCAYNIDTFKQWIAQNQNQLALAALNAVGTTVTGIATLDASTATSGVSQIANQLAIAADKSTLPPQAKGTGGSYITMAHKIKGFQFYNAHITYEFARIIDDYFSAYGYATHRVKIPNRSGRPHWNYVKTINVSITGSVPADDLVTIRRVYDNGVTFWNNGDEVGNYTLDNRPTS